MIKKLYQSDIVAAGTRFVEPKYIYDIEKLRALSARMEDIINKDDGWTITYEFNAGGNATPHAYEPSGKTKIHIVEASMRSSIIQAYEYQRIGDMDNYICNLIEYMAKSYEIFKYNRKKKFEKEQNGT